MLGLAAVGMGLTAAMQAIFFATGAERGPIYMVVQALVTVASLAAVVGLARRPPSAALLAAGLAGNAALRLLQTLTELSRLPLWVNLLLFAGYALAAVGAATWAARTQADPLRWARLGMWLVGVGYFVAIFDALGGGRLPAVLALLLGCIGTLLVAPNLRDASA